jgi:hypothetical protein
MTSAEQKQKEQKAKEELYQMYVPPYQNMIEGMHSEGKSYQEILQTLIDYGL